MVIQQNYSLTFCACSDYFARRGANTWHSERRRKEEGLLLGDNQKTKSAFPPADVDLKEPHEEEFFRHRRHCTQQVEVVLRTNEPNGHFDIILDSLARSADEIEKDCFSFVLYATYANVNEYNYFTVTGLVVRTYIYVCSSPTGNGTVPV